MERRDLGGPGGRVHGRAARISSLPLPIRDSRGENRRGAPPRRGRGRGLGSARMASGAAAGCGPVASSRFPFSASVLFFLFVRNNLLSKNERACVPRRDNGVRDGGFFFLGPKGKVVGLGCQARLLFSLCDWNRVGTPQDWTR